MYTISPAEAEGPLKQIHRSELCPAASKQIDLSINDPGLPEDLLMVNDYDDTPQPPVVVVELTQRPVTDVVEQDDTPPPQPDVVERLGAELEGSRRPRRTTAGQHRNPHHLPTTTQVNQILASWHGFHRPWL